jgi:hypothetical protein
MPRAKAGISPDIGALTRQVRQGRFSRVGYDECQQLFDVVRKSKSSRDISVRFCRPIGQDWLKPHPLRQAISSTILSFLLQNREIRRRFTQFPPFLPLFHSSHCKEKSTEDKIRLLEFCYEICLATRSFGNPFGWKRHNLMTTILLFRSQILTNLMKVIVELPGVLFTRLSDRFYDWVFHRLSIISYKMSATRPATIDFFSMIRTLLL